MRGWRQEIDEQVPSNPLSYDHNKVVIIIIIVTVFISCYSLY